MTRSTSLRFAPLLLLCVLAACQRTTPPPPHVKVETPSAPPAAPAAPAPASVAVSWVDPDEAASAPAAGTLDDSKDALMHEAFPAWHPDRPLLAALPYDPKQAQSVTVVLKPALVVAVDDDQRVLVVTATPSDNQGNGAAYHDQPGNVRTYGFQLRDGRWFRTSPPPTSTWTGYEGEPGKIASIELGPRHHALVVENGTCWQGFCRTDLMLLGLEVDEVTTLADLSLGSESTAATENCAAFVTERRANAAQVPKGLDEENCFATEGHWHLEPAPDSDWSDIVIAFTGRDIVTDPKTHALAAHDVDETLVLRRHGDKYEAVKGTNPTHGF